jgi:putative transposase
VNAIFYVTKTGCPWRYLPKEYPPWKRVYSYFQAWMKDGTWEKVLDRLNQKQRKKQGRKPAPSFAILDSQSVKTFYASEKRGIDGGKKNQGP